MITFKPLDTPEEWAYAKARCHIQACEDSQGIVALQDGRIIAICVADTFGRNKCHVHFAIDNPLVIRSGFLHEIARHLFLACGCDRIYGPVPAGNKKALKLDKHIGFSEVARIPNYYGDEDCVMLVMHRAASPWLTQLEAAA